MINFLHIPPISLLFSIMLMLGTYKFGQICVMEKNLKKIFSEISEKNFQNLIIGHSVSLLILFPLIAFSGKANLVLKLFGYILIFLSFFTIIDFIKILKKKFSFSSLLKYEFALILNIFLLVLYLLLSSSPETSADTLDYHIGTALNILRFDKYIFNVEWFTSLQAGIGETLIALGLSLGAEQFGSMVQFSSLLSITGIIFKISDKNKYFNSKYILNLVIISCPVLLFLSSGSKPQLFFSTLLLIALAIAYSKNFNKTLFTSYIIINTLIFLSIAGKFSYNLSGFLIWFLVTIKYIDKKNFIKLFSISTFCFLIILCPFVFLKWQQTGGDLINYFISPFPTHLPGYEAFLEHIRSPTYVKFPYFFFYNTSVSRISETLAFSSIILIILFLNFKPKKNEIFEIILLILSYLIVSNIYAEPNARYYFDVILWSGLAFKFIDKKFDFRIIKYGIFFQSLAVAFALLYSVSSLFPGTLTQELYNKVKNNSAFQYSGFNWLNENIPDNSSVIILERSVSVYKDFSISGMFTNFTNYDESRYYQEIIKKYKPEYIVNFGDGPRHRQLKGCVLDLYKKKENVGFHATRNPFGRGHSYNAYIYRFDYTKLPNCKLND